MEGFFLRVEFIMWRSVTCINPTQSKGLALGLITLALSCNLTSAELNIRKVYSLSKHTLESRLWSQQFLSVKGRSSSVVAGLPRKSLPRRMIFGGPGLKLSCVPKDELQS